MYLKSIEVQGFKSFANKIRFDFQHGITGIVGPNGSGKSNVGDAVRWVLGEQSARSLRGGNMQDVIFAGTELRKPQGFAYVAITMDNRDRALSIDYDEVKVSRRLYRSGESEYMLNESPCRLKDINELFFDTGIGQEGYSIIGQGQVEQILSGKAEERRELFDEAAGITKYRKRKALSEKRLESEQANLLRVGDILSELEKQVEPLRRQSESAKTYLRLKEEIKGLDLNLFLLECAAFRRDLEALLSKETILEEDRTEALASLEALKSEYEELEKAIGSLDASLEEKRGILAALMEAGGKRQGEIRVLEEQIRTEQANGEHIAARLQSIEQEKREKEAELIRLNRQKEETEEALSLGKSHVEERKKKLVSSEEAIMLLDRDVRSLKQSAMDLMNEKAEISARGERFKTLSEQLQVRASEAAQRILRAKTEEDAINESLRRENAKKAELYEKREEEKRRRLSEQEKASEHERALSGITASLHEIQTRYQAESARLESLKNLSERYDGYGNSIRRVMETRGRIRGIHGVVADLISTDQKYETAIETALGGKIQNIVTDSEETAKQLIAYLKKNRYGRATFLPLTSAKENKVWDPGAVRKEPGVIGIAADLVTTEPQYEALVRGLLGRDLVVSDIDRAVFLERKYHYSLRIVTPDGELLNPGGSISGGAFRNSSNLLGRKREIEELEATLNRLLKRSEATEAERSALSRALAESKEAMEQIRAEEQRCLLQWNTQEMAVQRLAEKKAELAAQLQDLTDERGRLFAQLEEIKESSGALRFDGEDLDQRKAELETHLASASEQLEAERKRRDALAASLSEVRLSANSAEQQIHFIEENRNRILAEQLRLQNEEEMLRAGADDASGRIAEKHAAIQLRQGEAERERGEREALEQELSKLIHEKEARAGEQKQYFSRRDEIAERESALDRDLFRIRAQKEKIEEHRTHRARFILSEYNLTEEGAVQYRSDALQSQTTAGIRQTMEQKNSQVRALGSVNVGAIEDYKQVSQRYSFMKLQYEDLKQAEASLLSVIAELDQGMRKQFKEQFARIGKEFNRVFRELFGGGRGELRLDQEADLLDASISIIAEPPGKKLQNMMQLSGGEKALTAISLLFAIQNLKPSPFALLDEIEAALDDSNVDRYAQYLRKLSDHTQFIVITHRRGTMVASDRLYGITMQEKGVSTLVSVNLIEDKLDP